MPESATVTSLLLVQGGDELDPAVVGGKAASLNRLMSLGMPVPPAFVLPTDHCREFSTAGDRLTEDAVTALRDGILHLESATGRGFGDAENPLLVSVRSGAEQSMPGMMDTVLNLGMTDAVERAWGRTIATDAFVTDTRRRFREQFTRVVGVAPSDDPWEQLFAAAAAVFRSWQSARAVRYREHHGISHAGGTAVTVQAMVFGNRDANSGTGVLFSRNPLTGATPPYGEWLPGVQGEDIVSGTTNALPLAALAEAHPAVHQQLLDAARMLERHTTHVQDIEFTVESGRLFLLQTRTAKRSPDAAARFSVSMHQEGLITRDEALRRVTETELRGLLRPRVHPDAKAGAHLLARGEAACPGIASGRAVGTAAEVEELHDAGVATVLVRPTTDPNDASGMILARAVVTEVGGATSHAAVVSRELGTPCVVGTGSGSLEALIGHVITVDGSTGEIFDGELPLAPATEADNPDLRTLATWARDRIRSDGSAADVIRAAQAAINATTADSAPTRK